MSSITFTFIFISLLGVLYFGHKNIREQAQYLIAFAVSFGVFVLSLAMLVHDLSILIK